MCRDWCKKRKTRVEGINRSIYLEKNGWKKEREIESGEGWR